jgi:hypothetical protein
MLIDAHSHVDRYDLMDGHVLESALAEIAQHRIFTISNSMDLPSYKRNLEISEKCDWCYLLSACILGMLPNTLTVCKTWMKRLSKARSSVKLDSTITSSKTLSPIQINRTDSRRSVAGR